MLMIFIPVPPLKVLHATSCFAAVILISKCGISAWWGRRPEEHAALRRLKPKKSAGLDSTFPEFILNDGSALKSWFCDFLTSCMRQLKIPKIWRRALIVVIAKPRKATGRPKELPSHISAVYPL